jgi:hypothetical protein
MSPRNVLVEVAKGQRYLDSEVAFTTDKISMSW